MCLYPFPVFITRDRNKKGEIKERIHFFKAKNFERGDKPTIYIPCGKCYECLLSEKKKWKQRIMYETKKHKYNYFITLTYKKKPKELEYRDIQLFLKKLRNKTNEKFKYYVVGEYGEKTKRGHWHIALHGLDLEDTLKLYKLGTNGGYFNSTLLDKCWGKGWAVITGMSEATAAYIAAYCLKKYEQRQIHRASIHYGMRDTIEFKYYRDDGTELTRREKEEMRKKDQERYYKLVDEHRQEIEKNKQQENIKKMLQEERKKVYNKINKNRKGRL